jgi:membrane protease subunit (stomatin/prohibitin family)
MTSLERAKRINTDVAAGYYEAGAANLREYIRQEIDEAVAVAEQRQFGIFRTALGMSEGETIADWLRRKQDEVNQQREEAVAAERWRCARIVVFVGKDLQEANWIAERIRSGEDYGFLNPEGT